MIIYLFISLEGIVLLLACMCVCDQRTWSLSAANLKYYWTDKHNIFFNAHCWLYAEGPLWFTCLQLHTGSSRGRRHYVFRSSHIFFGHDISKMHHGNFIRLGSNGPLGLKGWTDLSFGGHRSRTWWPHFGHISKNSYTNCVSDKITHKYLIG